MSQDTNLIDAAGIGVDVAVEPDNAGRAVDDEEAWCCIIPNNAESDPVEWLLCISISGGYLNEAGGDGRVGTEVGGVRLTDEGWWVLVTEDSYCNGYNSAVPRWTSAITSYYTELKIQFHQKMKNLYDI